VERILLASQAGSLVASSEDLIFVALDSDDSQRIAFRLLAALWRAGARAEMEQGGRSPKGQLKHASRSGARAVILVGEDGLRVRDMSTREEETASNLEHAVALAIRSPAPVEARA
jgi:histidyl-tRNA synthetase